MTDNNGCTATDSVTINEPNALTTSTSYTSALCNGSADGTIDLTVSGGNAPYIYSWSNGAATEDLTGLVAGTYTAIVTDDSGCTTTAIVTITEPSLLVATSTSTNVSCNSDANGTIDLTVSGGDAPYSYDWSNTATTEDLTGLAAGTYTVIVTDNNGCTVTETVVISEPTLLTATATADNTPQCIESTDGAATVIATGGTAPYSYLWDNGETTESATMLTIATHTVTVTDNNGCTTVATVIINYNDTLNPTPDN
ncbi:SprB repeat-containing protein, partial [Neptunitalea chrysea]|uniref:SprB repeat-containing protein n=1 Tax=Neptunitalea chrysea TaxID=1647581 RepID=UPI0035A2405F